MTTADLLLDELIKAGNDLIQNHGNHDGCCTNEHQMKLLPKVADCTKHQSALRTREERFRRALDQLTLLRDVFSNSPS